jgi:branched-chain amino acid transport system permease protein
MEYILSISTFAVIWAILALSLNILLGYAGQVSVGHAAFFGIGAYTAAILSTRYHIPFLLTIPASMLVTAFVGMILGLPSLRVRHDFLVLVTIGLNFIFVGTLTYTDFFGGALGIVGIPAPAILGMKLKGMDYLLFCTSFLLLTAWINWVLPRTWGSDCLH